MTDRVPELQPAASATPAGEINAPRPGPGRMWLFIVTTFLSALLLFSVQPMFAKMVLPVLGGSPSVWAVAMFFFQGALLAGYCYAHLLISYLPLRIGGLVHLAVCALAFIVLPIGLPAWFGEPPPGEPYLWQLGLFAVAVGLPFLAVSANAPLLQAWFSASRDPRARDPYFLYAASNLGSLIALLGYPLVLEPAWGVSQLAVYWTIGFGLLALAIALTFWSALTGARASAANPAQATAATAATTPPARAPSWVDRAGWVGLALVPSALLTAFTTHVTTDVASAPLLWVIPLALYLLTFVLVFRERSIVPRRLLLIIHLASVIAALVLLAQTRNEGWFVTAPVGMLVFFCSAMVAHRTLYEARPDARHLTEFYLWMSLGGALGGLSAALVAPKLFSEVFEYPLLLALSMACRPNALSIRRWKLDDWLALWLVVAAGILAIYWMPWAIDNVPPVFEPWRQTQTWSGALWWLSWPLGIINQAWLVVWRNGAAVAVVTVMAIILLASYASAPRQLVAALMMVAAVTTLPSQIKRGEASRSYFGVYRVQISADGQFNTLIHGTTLHGAQRVRDQNGNQVADATPGTYYHPGSPMAEAVRRMRRVAEEKGRMPRFGMIGLGTGSMACHAQKGEAWRFYEIDPLMVSIAQSDRFTFLDNCLPKPDIVIGDARLTVAKEPDASFDLIIVDAFSSDAVPVHLMTVEALRLYMAKVRPDGVALLHISNRYLDLDAVLAATRLQIPGLAGVLISDDLADGSYAQSTSTVAVFARTEEVLAQFREVTGARDFSPPRMRAWTDDYSDIIAPFMSMARRRFVRPAATADVPPPQN